MQLTSFHSALSTAISKIKVASSAPPDLPHHSSPSTSKIHHHDFTSTSPHLTSLHTHTHTHTSQTTSLQPPTCPPSPASSTPPSSAISNPRSKKKPKSATPSPKSCKSSNEASPQPRVSCPEFTRRLAPAVRCSPIRLTATQLIIHNVC